jgi:hypothetical protein
MALFKKWWEDALAYSHTPEELQAVGDFLLTSRWKGLVYFNADPDPKWQFIERAMDMNGDGAVTVSDVGLWAKWMFGLPGDYVLILVMRQFSTVAHFLEVGPALLGGLLSWGISALAGVMLFKMIEEALEASGSARKG